VCCITTSDQWPLIITISWNAIRYYQQEAKFWSRKQQKNKPYLYMVAFHNCGSWNLSSVPQIEKQNCYILYYQRKMEGLENHTNLVGDIET
jgi:hypothetical protein